MMMMFYSGWLVGIACSLMLVSFCAGKVELGLIVFGIPALVMTLVAIILDD